MRRGHAILIVAALLVAAAALPLAEAQKAKGKGNDKGGRGGDGILTPISPPDSPPARDADEHKGDEHDEDDHDEKHVPSKAAFDTPTLKQAARRGEATGLLALGGVVAALLLALALAGIWWARRPSKRRPPKKTFEAGRSKAHEARPETPEQAIQAFAAGKVGTVVFAAPVLEGYEVTVARKRGQPCHQTAGYLAGLFEAAWADAVRIEHPGCAGEGGGECRYVVRRGALLSSGDRPTGEASTPGSPGGHRRSSRARHGGG